jgi:hypothetical protein
METQVAPEIASLYVLILKHDLSVLDIYEYMHDDEAK